MEGPIHLRLFDHRQATVVAGVEEKNGPWTVRVVPAIALFPTALLAIAHAIDTLTVWAMDLYLDHSVLLCGPWQMRHSTSMSTHVKHHPRRNRVAGIPAGASYGPPLTELVSG